MKAKYFSHKDQFLLMTHQCHFIPVDLLVEQKIYSIYLNKFIMDQ